MRKAIDATVTGRVQGVGFRYETERAAQRLRVTGWVRNEPDGGVAVHVEGDARSVDAMVEWLHDGPSLARVQRVAVRPGADEGATSFDVRF